MKPYLRYLVYIVHHKWFVFVECCRLGIPWLGVIHDWSKFLPSEWFPYAAHFYGPNSHHKDGSHLAKGIEDDDPGFDYAWLYHQHRNRHHWQYWALVQDDDEDKCLPIPSRYRREMLADWIGAGRAQGTTDNLGWYIAHREKILLHPNTRAWIERMLGYDRTT